MLFFCEGRRYRPIHGKEFVDFIFVRFPFWRLPLWLNGPKMEPHACNLCMKLALKTVNLRTADQPHDLVRSADQRKRQLMTKTRKNLLCRAAAAFITAAALFASSPASADAGFETWINSFYATAAKSGITKATYRQAFAGVKTPDPDVLEKARYQPEFKHKIWEYIDSRVNPYTTQDRTGDGGQAWPNAGRAGAPFRHRQDHSSGDLVDGIQLWRGPGEGRAPALCSARAGHSCLCRSETRQICQDPVDCRARRSCRTATSARANSTAPGQAPWATRSSSRPAICSTPSTPMAMATRTSGTPCRMLWRPPPTC